MDQSTHVDQFVRLARQFVVWCNTDHVGKNPSEFKVEALQKLAAVYDAGLHLPNVLFTPAPDAPRVTATERQIVARNLLALPFQYYWNICEPAIPDKDNEAGCGDLFDDFQDIYADISSGLWLFDSGHTDAAVYSWREMFRAHWGRHAVSAMHALHSFEYGE